MGGSPQSNLRTLSRKLGFYWFPIPSTMVPPEASMRHRGESSSRKSSPFAFFLFFGVCVNYQSKYRVNFLLGDKEEKKIQVPVLQWPNSPTYTDVTGRH